jgi:hypothetical protein
MIERGIFLAKLEMVNDFLESLPDAYSNPDEYDSATTMADAADLLQAIALHAINTALNMNRAIDRTAREPEAEKKSA